MSGRVMVFGAGAAIGYVLGTRAGRQRYDEITGKAKQIWESDTVQEAAGVVQGRAGQLYDEGKKMVSGQADKMSGRHDQGFAERNRKAPPSTESSSSGQQASNPPETSAGPTTLPPGTTPVPTTL